MPWIEPGLQNPVDSLFPAWFMEHWANLALRCDLGDPVCCAPVWNLAYQEVFYPERPIFYSASDDSLIVLAEYVTETGEPILTPMEDSWLFGQPLLGDTSPALLAALMPEISARYSDGVPKIFISGIQEQAIFAHTLFNIFSKRYSFYRRASAIEAAASLDGGMDGWLGRRSANHRAKLRKAMRKAREAGITFERIRPNTINVDSIYDRMLAIEAKSWKGIDHCGMTEPPSREFYQALIRRQAANGAALVILASRDGEELGFIYGGCAGSIYRGQQFSYAREAESYSLGNLMQMEKVRWLCELGLKRYDMGPVTGPRMGYKKHWTEQFREIQTWMLC